jgi:hypothetical protein
MSITLLNMCSKRTKLCTLMEFLKNRQKFSWFLLWLRIWFQCQSHWWFYSCQNDNSVSLQTLDIIYVTISQASPVGIFSSSRLWGIDEVRACCVLNKLPSPPPPHKGSITELCQGTCGSIAGPPVPPNSDSFWGGGNMLTDCAPPPPLNVWNVSKLKIRVRDACEISRRPNVQYLERDGLSFWRVYVHKWGLHWSQVTVNILKVLICVLQTALLRVVNFSENEFLKV